MQALAKLLALCLAAAQVEAFGVGSSRLLAGPRLTPPSRNARRIEAVVVDISSTDEFNEALESAGDSLVVVDYSTSWCGPCKIIAPKFDELSETYKNVAFLKVLPLF